jgi:hypothetical protein
MVLDIEEIVSAQVVIALGVAGLQACRVDRQLDRRVGAQVKPAVVVLEVSRDRRQAPQQLHAELDAGALAVQPPTAADRLFVGGLLNR